MKTFFIDNHGCAKNQVDAEEMAEHLRRHGYTQLAQGETADLIIVNSCGFIESAKKESIEAALAIRSAWPDKKLILAGCLSQRYADELYNDMPELDGVFGNSRLSQITEVADKVMQAQRSTLVPPRQAYDPAPRGRLTGYPRFAYLKISEGCSNRCSFCAIPLIRGDISSRSIDSVIAEFRQLLAQDSFEICLIGQDLGSFGLESSGRAQLPELLAAISALQGDFRVRLLYIHPDRFPLEILDACKRDPRILPYFDIPFQHASTGILRAMNRQGTAEKYLELLATIRETLPDAVIRTTFLVGFPGESEEDFAELLRFQQAARPDWLGCFAYSREEDTPAYNYKQRVPQKTATQRKQLVEETQIALTANALQRHVGTVQRILIEERIEGEDLAIGRGSMNAPEVDGLIVVVGGDCQAGQTRTVRISAVRGVDLEAVPCES
ncbi:MAG: 30S ribosomal protein S12 methylthiotransferase RimO [Spirochaetes bacterium]|nr:30S ribosomal protein S12 methylthiotransferase RimO [Spirochaetota bacterium]MBU0955721.1 30S ribosomal protein S12 methylthiotransferase RimO [Spirochaetota bacterium]